ncbi:MAG: hypothetical protein ACODAJ_07200 [Planctomycetota bacterium]
MASTECERILREAEQLPPDEQLELIERLAARLRTRPEPGKKRPRWEDLAGTAPYPLCGEDAQEYISKMRDEWEEREKNL